VARAQAVRPNIVVILAHNLGWMDINPTAEYATGTPTDQQYCETPHLNELARDGVASQGRVAQRDAHSHMWGAE